MAKKKTLKTKNLRDVPLETVEDLKSLNRFSADHIIRTKYNPSTKAVVMEDIPAGLKSEFTLGESGGGGVSNTILTMNVVNNSGEDFEAYRYSLDENNMVIHEALMVGETATVDTLVIPAVNEGTYYYIISFFDYFSAPAPPTSSDTVNCTVETDPFGGVTVIITDPTLPASVTFTIGA